MSYRRLVTFESLENRRALAVTATVSTDGDLNVVSANEEDAASAAGRWAFSIAASSGNSCIST